jgi:outer membrane protein assembly factor BamB
MLNRFAIGSMFVFASVVALPAAGGLWPQWRGPQRDGVSTETGLLASWPAGGPPKLWTASGLGAGFSSLAIANGRIFTMGDRSDGQYIVALDEQTGKPLWATRVGQRHDDPDGLGGARATPTVDGDLLYTTTTDGDLYALETATGKMRWKKSLPNDFGGRMMSQWRWAESPLVDGDRVVVTPGGSKTSMIALDKKTGAGIWFTTVPRLGSEGSDGAGYSSIVISNGGGVKQYIQLMGRGVVSIRASDGWYMWGYNRVANNIANISTPVVSGNYVFASTSYDAGSALLEIAAAPEGRVTARQKYFISPGQFQNHHGGVVLLGGYLYGGHGRSNGVPVCIELSTGKLMWPRARGAGSGSAAVTAADGHIYFRYQDGTMALVEASPAEYKETGRFTIPDVHAFSWSHPVITGGRLYLREQDALHVYNIKK